MSENLSVPKNNEKFYNSFELRHTICAGPLPGLDFQFRFPLYLLQLFYLIKTLAKEEMIIYFMERLKHICTNICVYTIKMIKSNSKI